MLAEPPLFATSARSSTADGAVTYPILMPGAMILENDATYIVLSESSSEWIEVG